MRKGLILMVAISVVVAAGPVSADSAVGWAESAKLTVPDPHAGGGLSGGVAVYGDTLVVGSPGDDGAGDNSGAAYVFSRTSSGWTAVAKLRASDGAAGDRFGRFVAMSDNTVMVESSGTVYVFTRIRSRWRQSAKLAASDGVAFGPIAVSGDTAVFGATSDGAGSAYVFSLTQSGWVQEAKLTASDGVSGDEFGTVDISGNMIVIGARFSGELFWSGSAYVFNRTPSGWVETTKLVGSDTTSLDQFGWSVGVSGKTIVIGARYDESLTGAAYVYKHTPSGWVETAKLTASNGEYFDMFGLSVDISMNTIVVGARGDTETGQAYVFSRTPSGWVESAHLVASDADVFDLFGDTVGVSSDTIVIGATYDGSVYVYTR